jgi:hypothetical protein
MRLLNAETYAFANSSEIAKENREYAILSHTWLRKQGDEVTYMDMKTRFKDISQLKPVGWRKLTNFCKFATQRGHQWVWIDTCCINTADANETQSSIHGMYEYYADAVVCYAHLADVDCTADRKTWEAQLKGTRWFRRGWTLQELLAPKDLVYVDREWRIIGNRRDIQDIPGPGLGDALKDRRIRLNNDILVNNNLTTQLSWASQRETTILEDQAYSICGLLQIKLPVRYGEGKNAFIRLQKELINKYCDISILAWFSTVGMLLSILSSLDIVLTDPIDSRRRYRKRHGCDPPELGILAPSIDFFYKVPRAKKILNESWRGRDPDTDIIAAPECLHVQANIFQIEIAIMSSGLSEPKLLVQLHHDQKTKIRVGIIVVPDSRNRNRYVRKFHERTLFLFNHAGKQNTCKGTFGPGYPDPAVSENSQNYKVKVMGVKWIFISYN